MARRKISLWQRQPIKESVGFKALEEFVSIDLFHIVCAHAYIGHVARYFSIIGETLQRWGKRILSH